MSDKDNYFKDIENTIKNYLKEKNTDYGIMLTGEWGAGKTYYVKNYLGFIKEELQLNEPLYVSVLGKNTIDEIVNDIYLSELFSIDNVNNINFIKTIAKSGGKTLFDILKMLKVDNTDNVSNLIGSITNITTEMSKKIINFENRLIIIDEIERLPNNIEVDNFLYAIYDIFISNNIKVLFVCNENEIYKKYENYKNIKEKVIRYTNKIHGVDSNNFIEFINTIKKDFIKSDDINQYFIYDGFFTDKLIPTIGSLFIKMDCFNMRTFLKFIDMSKYFLYEINKYIENKDFCLNYNEELFLEILKNFAFVLISYDKGIDTNILSNFDLLNSNEFSKKTNEDKSKITIDFTYINSKMKKLNLKYNNSIFYFYKYIECGLLDFEQIYLIYKNYIYLDKEYLRALDIVRECDYGFDEIKKNADLIIEKMKNEKKFFSIEECWKIYSLLFIRYKDLFIYEKDKYLQVIKDTLKFCWENEDYNSIIVNKNSYESKDFNFHPVYCLVREIYKSNNNDILIEYESNLLNELSKKQKEIDKKIVDKLLEKFDSKDKDYFYNKISYEEKVLLFTDEVINNLPRTLFTINIYIMIFSDVVSVGICFDNYKTYYDNSITDVDIIKRVLSFVDKIQTTDKYFIFKINELKDLLKAKYECTKNL